MTLTATTSRFCHPLRRLLFTSLLLAAASICASAQTSSTTGSDRTTPHGLEPGAPAGSYPLSGFENVNLYNGNLNFHLPLLKVGGRGAAGYTITLGINTKRWGVKYSSTETTETWTPTPNRWILSDGYYGVGKLEGRKSGFGLRNVSGCNPYPPGKRFYQTTLTTLTFVAPDGTEFDLRDQASGGARLGVGPCPVFPYTGASRGTVFVSAEGSGATFISDTEIFDKIDIPTGTRTFTVSGVLLLKDGTRYRVDNGRVTSVQDRFGNTVTVGASSIVDSLGREVVVEHDVTDPVYGLCDRLKFKGVGGVERIVYVTKSSLGGALRAGFSLQSYVQLFPELNGAQNHGITPYDPTVVSGVVLPDGQSYQFRYNSYAELARVVLPMGGAIEYDMVPGSGVITATNGQTDAHEIYRRVATRRTYADGVTLESQTSYTENVNQAHISEDVYNSSGTMLTSSRHYFYGTARDSLIQQLDYEGFPEETYPSWDEGLQSAVESYNTNGTSATALLRRVVYAWQPGATMGGFPVNPRMVSSLTTLADTNQVSKVTSINPQTGAVGFDQFNNQTDLWEYDFGVGAPPAHPVRHTHTDYLTTNNGIDYTARTATSPHICNLARAQQVYSIDPSTGVETLIAQTETRYDEAAYPVLTYDGVAVPGWSNPGTTARGLATTARRWLDTSNTWIEAHTQFDQLGNVRKTWDPKGNLTQVDYADSFSDQLNRNTFALPTSTISPVPDPTGQYGSATSLTDSTRYDYWTGLITSAIDANAQVTSFEYNDVLDRLTRVVRPPGAGATRYKYNQSAGNPSGTSYVETFTDLDQSRSMYSFRFFDGMGRHSRSFRHVAGVIASGQDKYLTTDIQYDALGRAWRASDAYTSSGSTSAIPSTARWTETAFDALGRTLKVKTTADGATIRMAYWGNKVQVTDQAGRSRRSETDALGKLTAVVEYTRTLANPEVVEAPLASDYVTAYKHDALGNLRKVEHGPQSRFFMYDSLGRLIRTKNPEQSGFIPNPAEGFPSLTDATSGTSNSQWSLGYIYDANGNLLKRIDARNLITSYGYDNINRTTSVNYSDTPALSPDIKRLYDHATQGRGRLWKSYAGGDETTGVNVDMTEVASYDEAGRPRIQRQYFKTNSQWPTTFFEVKREYSLAGNVTQMTYPSGHTASYQYDVAGRLADNGSQTAFRGTLGDGVLRTYASEVQYDDGGRAQQERFGTTTPVYDKSFYNSRGQLAEIRVSTHSILAAGQETNWNRGAIINHFSDAPGAWGATGGGPDNNGNLKKQEIYVPNDDQISSHWHRAQYFNYDALNRLDSAEERTAGGTLQWKQDYSYDRWGNRTIDLAGTSGGVNATQFSVDPVTNRLGVPVGSPSVMTYDAAGNLVVDTYTGQGTRTFNAEGRMTSAQDSSGQTSSYTYNADNRRVRQQTGGSTVWQVYGMSGELLAEYTANTSPASPQKEYGYRGGALLVTAEAAPPVSGGADAVWFDDQLPAGAVPHGNGEGWTWVTSNPAPHAGSSSHQSANASGFHNHYFTSASQTLQVGAGDMLYAYVYLDPSNPTQEVMLQWHDGVEWKNAYWGADLLNWVSRTYAGPLPAAGQWARLEVSAAALGLEGKTLSGMAFNVWDGRATFDLAGKSSPQPETVWVEDALPAGAVPFSNNETWNWVSSTPAPQSGSSAHQSANASGFHNHYFQSATQMLSVNAGDKLFAYVYLDPQNPTRELMLQWHDGVEWKNAYWGEDLLNWVTRTYVGPLPAAGQWARLEVPASLLGLEGKTLSGMAFNVWDGRATWDRAGKSAGGAAAQVRWLVSDHLGTPRMVIDQTGALSGVKRHDYLPFGEELTTGGRTVQHGYASDTVKHKFTSYKRDSETGLDFAQARYYASSQGRFTSPDSFGGSMLNPKTLNLYSYVHNNPLKLSDPTGHLAKDRAAEERDLNRKMRRAYWDGYFRHLDYQIMVTTGMIQGDGDVNWVADGSTSGVAAGAAAGAEPTQPRVAVLIVGDPGLANHDNGSNFMRAAETEKQELERAGLFVKIVRASTVEDFNSALNLYNYVTVRVVYFGHAGPGALFIGEGKGENTNLTAENLSRLDGSKLRDGAQIILRGCNSATRDDQSIAAMMSRHLGLMVAGYDGNLSFSGNPNVRAKGKNPPASGPLYAVPDPGVRLVAYGPPLR